MCGKGEPSTFVSEHEKFLNQYIHMCGVEKFNNENLLCVKNQILKTAGPTFLDSDCNAYQHS
jgi:hypothetical protein